MKRNILILFVAVIWFRVTDASAFWWSDTKEPATGLDVAAGFDVNTVTTLSGTIMTLPERKAQDHTLMSVTTPQGDVTVVLGPWWYWERQTFKMSKNQEIIVTGSRAQGKDGVLYIFAQRIETRNNGESLTLRTESGLPLWSRTGSGNQNGMRQHDGSGSRTGTPSRGGGYRGGRR